jgi:hypothetical protein
LSDGNVHLLRQPAFINGLSLFAANEEIGKGIVAREATNMRCEDSIATGNHIHSYL